jgi:hypothetical protein
MTMYARNTRALWMLILVSLPTAPLFAQEEATGVLESLSNIGMGMTKAPVDPRDFESQDIDGNSHR